MSSLTPKDRVSLCMFTYADGRRCRTPRISTHPHFCYDHAQKEARAVTADKLARDLEAFFSGHYISANDLSTALARLLPAVVRGDIKPRTARTVAYMAQTLLQSIHHAQSEFHDAFGPDNYRKSIRSGITSNHSHLFPPEAQPAAQPAAENVSAQPLPAQPVPVAVQPDSPLAAPAVPTPVPAALPAMIPPAPNPPTPSPATKNPPPAPNIVTQPPPQPAPNTQIPTNGQRRPLPPSPHRNPYVTHFDDNYRLVEREKAY
jgi:hypothetical protein